MIDNWQYAIGNWQNSLLIFNTLLLLIAYCLLEHFRYLCAS